jgi:hypothetical protein
VQLGERSLRFWLEWDRGTMKLQDLQLKFATYAMYLMVKSAESTGRQFHWDR